MYATATPAASERKPNADPPVADNLLVVAATLTILTADESIPRVLETDLENPVWNATDVASETVMPDMTWNCKKITF